MANEYTNDYLEALRLRNVFRSVKNFNPITYPPPPPDVIPGSLDWSSVQYDASTNSYTYATAQITQTTGDIILSLEWSDSDLDNKIVYKIADSGTVPGSAVAPKDAGGFTLISTSGIQFSASPNKHVIFGLTASGASYGPVTVTVKNASSGAGNPTLDTFTATQLPPDVTPTSLNWTYIQYSANDLFEEYSYTSQQITDTTNGVTLAVEWSSSDLNDKIVYKIADTGTVPDISVAPKDAGGFTLISTSGIQFRVPNNKHVIFGMTASGSNFGPAGITVKNVTDENAVLDGFTASRTTLPQTLRTTELMVHLDAANVSSYDPNNKGATWFNLITGNGITGAVLHSIIGPNPGTTFVRFSDGVSGMSLTPAFNGFLGICGDDASEEVMGLTYNKLRTAQTWVYITDWAAGSNKGIFGKQSGINTLDGWRLVTGVTNPGYLGPISNGASAGLRLVINGATGEGFNVEKTINSSERDKLGKFNWHFLTVIHGLTSTTNAIKVYIDAGYTMIETNFDTGISPVFGCTADFVMGRPFGDTGGDNIGARFGALYLYDRPLTRAEIINNYNATKTRYGL